MSEKIKEINLLIQQGEFKKSISLIDDILNKGTQDYRLFTMKGLALFSLGKYQNSIEYFTKSGNTLGQLRRGTLGTGIKDHSDGTLVVDASGTQTIPYADTIYTNTFTGDGSTVVFALSQTPASASE